MVTHLHVSLNGIDMHIAEQGDGPLVLLLHGWPESWYSWRHQIDALSAAGYRVVAPDQRGYGATDRPDAVDQYSIFHLVGDLARGLACVAIPPIPRGPLPPMTETEQRFGKGFYQNYFQEPGVAEASLGDRAPTGRRHPHRGLERALRAARDQTRDLRVRRGHRAAAARRGQGDTRCGGC